MLGILIQLILSWIILQFLAKASLDVLGYRITIAVFQLCVFLFLFTMLSALLGYALRWWFGERWGMNPDFSLMLFVNGVWWNIKSVLFEELIFRGALFYLLIQWLGAKKALMLSAGVFGVYHWFSYEILGQPIPMLVIFLLTATAGLVYGYAYLKTATLYAPIAMHFAWNFTNNFLFSGGQIGKGIFVPLPTDAVQVGYIAFVLVQYLPMAVFFVGNYFLLKRFGKVNVDKEHQAPQL
jgi:membrane protease YdiL (CAAX protease family)